MSSSRPRPMGASSAPVMPGGVVDLGAVKAQAEARAQRESSASSGIGASRVSGGGVTDLTPAALEQDVLARSAAVPVVVILGSSRAEESEQLRSDFADLARARAGRCQVVYADIDQHPELAQIFGIQAIPTVVAVAAGRPVTHFAGGQPRAALEEWIDQLIQAIGPQLSGPDPVDSTADHEAEDTTALGDPTGVHPEVRAILRSVAEESTPTFAPTMPKAQPTGSDALATNARRLALRRAGHQDDAGGDPWLAEADDALLADDLDRAFGILLEHATPGDPAQATAKARLVEFFTLVIPDDPRTLSARSAMASLLF